MVYRLDDDLWFPDPKGGEPDGCIAIGGDLSPERLILAYSNGIFPWYAYKREVYGDLLEEGEEVPIQWFCPMERFVFFPDQIHISHSMRNLINKQLYDLTMDEDFSGVINGCHTAYGRDKEEEAWLGPDMIAAYTKLHEMGYAHSVEVWDKDHNLVGGLYGMMLGKIFFGESMFSLKPNTSKLALIALGNWMMKTGGLLIDSQVENPHTKSLGGVTITYDEFIEILDKGILGDLGGQETE